MHSSNIVCSMPHGETQSMLVRNMGIPYGKDDILDDSVLNDERRWLYNRRAFCSNMSHLDWLQAGIVVSFLGRLVCMTDEKTAL